MAQLDALFRACCRNATDSTKAQAREFGQNCIEFITESAKVAAGAAVNVDFNCRVACPHIIYTRADPRPKNLANSGRLILVGCLPISLPHHR